MHIYKMRKIMSTAFVALCLGAPLAASTISVVDFSGSGATFLENPLRTSTGAVLPSGSALIRIGYFRDFSPSNTALLNALKDPFDKSVTDNAIANFFVPLGEGLDPDLGPPPAANAVPRLANRTINGVANTPGRLAGAVASVKPVAGPPNSFNPANIAGVPAGTRLFLLAYDSTSIATANSMAIVSATTWLMPSDDLANLAMNTVQVDTPEEYFRGTPGSIMLAPWIIPEPSTSLLALLSGLLFIRRRR